MTFETRMLARMTTAIENREPTALSMLDMLEPGHARIVGITGPPGAGKSTLVDALAVELRRQGKTVAILAVDPTSRRTGGALLGDRIRMQQHYGDPGIFIRSMATRGEPGGIARATADVARLMDAAGKDYVLIETVGVGQDEIDIVRLADCVVVVLVPGLGDDIQNMKAGLMEIGDIFVLNKSDREGADRLEEQLHAMLSLVMPRVDRSAVASEKVWHPPVIRTVASENRGVDALAETIAKFRTHFESSGERTKKHTEHWRNHLLELLESRLVERVLNAAGGEAALNQLASDVAERRKDPFAAVNEILAKSGLETPVK